MSQPSAAELSARKTVRINRETVDNITSTDFPGHHTGEDASFSLQKFSDGLTFQFHKNDALESTFSLIGVDASLANAFRRILLAETPSLAIEYCYFLNNTSVIHDEVLAHRLGLIPLKASRSGLRWLKYYQKPDMETGLEGTETADYNTVVLTLNVKCEWLPNPSEEEDAEPEEKFSKSSVYARDIQWKCMGQQKDRFQDGPVEVVNPDILIAKMRPGQEIDVEMHAILGVGADHAKFSPVGTATYRLLPKIEILKPILGGDALKFQKCFPQGVINLERVTARDAREGGDFEGREGDEKAVVADVMKDTVSRECLRHDEFTGKVKLGRVQDHFVFNVESTGQWRSDDLFLTSVDVLRFKAKRLLAALDNLES